MWQLLAVVAVIAFIILCVAHTTIQDGRHFKNKGISYGGHFLIQMIKNLKEKKVIRDLVLEGYENAKKSKTRIGGSRDFGKLNYIITDVNHFKSVMVKDFDHFVNRRQLGFKDNDPLTEFMLLFLTDEQWKQMRSKLSPTFTTGKIKRMFPLFEKSGEKIVKFIENEMKNSHGEIDISEAYSKFTMDVIANAVCGFDSHAFDQKEPAIFEKMGKKIQDANKFEIKRMIAIIFLTAFPKFAKFCGITLFGDEVSDFFTAAIKSVIKRRRETGEKRDDFIQLMMEAGAGNLKTDENELEDFEKDAQIKNVETKANILDDNGIVSNCVLFILAGFDTTQSLLIFFVYALALYPDIQKKLQDEVDAVFEENNGKLTYDAVSKMTYLDMVINETLRLYPPAPMMDRECTKRYQFPGTDILVQPGETILLSFIGLHYNEEYWKEPEVFNPERFSPENKRRINPYAFVPFGQGPRNCIGMRFALMEVKVALLHIIKNFSVEPSNKTNIPMKYDNSTSLKPAGGMWLAFNKRVSIAES